MDQVVKLWNQARHIPVTEWTVIFIQRHLIIRFCRILLPERNIRIIRCIVSACGKHTLQWAGVCIIPFHNRSSQVKYFTVICLPIYRQQIGSGLYRSGSHFKYPILRYQQMFLGIYIDNSIRLFLYINRNQLWQLIQCQISGISVVVCRFYISCFAF